MSYHAIVLRVLIASPSDVKKERNIIPEVIASWNALNSTDMKVVLLPVMWETHASPEMGDRPQAIINKQIVKDCDLLIGAFWTRIGTHTGVSESGTVEEIEEFQRAGKSVMLYFSYAPVLPDSIDPEQYKKLVIFRDKCLSQGLVERYDSIGEFRDKLNMQLALKIKDIYRKETGKSIEETPEKSKHTAYAMMTAQLGELIKRYEVDWVTEKNSDPVGIDDGKNIIQELKEELLSFRASLGEEMDGAFRDKLDENITKLKTLQRHEVYLDGGKSYHDFWQIGDDILLSLNTISSQLAANIPIDKDKDLDEPMVNIVNELGLAENQGRPPIRADYLGHILGLSTTQANYYLDRLCKLEYVYDLITIGSPTAYVLAPKGREYLVKKGLS